MAKPGAMDRESPSVRDSDVIYLAIKRLEAVANKMMLRQYDSELDALMKEASDWFEWAALAIGKRENDAE